MYRKLLVVSVFITGHKKVPLLVRGPDCMVCSNVTFGTAKCVRLMEVSQVRGLDSRGHNIRGWGHTLYVTSTIYFPQGLFSILDPQPQLPLPLLVTPSLFPCPSFLSLPKHWLQPDLQSMKGYPIVCQSISWCIPTSLFIIRPSLPYLLSFSPLTSETGLSSLPTVYHSTATTLKQKVRSPSPPHTRTICNWSLECPLKLPSYLITI